MADVPSISSMHEQSRIRKEKLLALRKKASAKEEEDKSTESATQDEVEPPKKIIKFRNYYPKDEALKDKKVPNSKPLSVEDEVKEHLEKAKPETVVEEVDLANLAPRKPDWDLKRDIAKKLEKLEKRTQKAIIEILREQLEGNKEDLATAVNVLADGSLA